MAVVGGYEVEQLRTCFPAVGESYQPKLGVVVVQKRINTRLFSVQVSQEFTDFEAPNDVANYVIISSQLLDNCCF